MLKNFRGWDTRGYHKARLCSEGTQRKNRLNWILLPLKVNTALGGGRKVSIVKRTIPGIPGCEYIKNLMTEWGDTCV